MKKKLNLYKKRYLIVLLLMMILYNLKLINLKSIRSNLMINMRNRLKLRNREKNNLKKNI